MPRGVTIPELKEQLFAAAERVINDSGPGRLTSRAVTGAASVATGLLYAHFGDFDNFLAGFAVNRSFQVAGEVTSLSGRVGTDTVAENVSRALGSLPLLSLRALLRLLASRPDLAVKVQEVLGPEGGGLDAVRRVSAAYLVAEQQLGRLPPQADTEALAVSVTAVLHHVVLTEEIGSKAERSIDNALAAFIPIFRVSTAH